FFHVEHFNHVVHVNRIHVVERNTALKAVFDFSDVFFEALQSGQLAFPNLLTSTNESSHSAAFDETFGDHTTSNGSGFGDTECLTPPCLSDRLLRQLGCQHAFHCGTHVIEHVVDD